MRTFIIVLGFSLIVLWAGESQYIKEAEQLLKEHHFKQAFARLQAHQDDPDALYYLSVIKLLQGEIDEALNFAKTGLQKAQNKGRFYEWLGDIYSVKAQTANLFSALTIVKKIKQYWLKAIEWDPHNVKVKEKLFMFYMMAPGIAGGDEQKARALIEEVEKEDSLRALLLKARFWQKKKEMDRSRKLYEQALHRAPDSLNVLREAGLFYLTQEQYAQARRCFQKIVALQPENFTGYDLLGDWFSKKAQFDSALAEYDRALAKDPYQFKTAFKKARVLAKLGRKEEARKVAESLLQAEIFFTMKKQIKAFLEELD